MSHSRFSPKDFFLWFGAMVALYVSAGSLVALLFNYVNVLIPDALDQSYYDPYSGPIRFAMASIVVACPLFLYLTRMVHQEMRADHEKTELGVRKWLVYLTVFVAGVLLAGDLITLIYTFLNGEVTLRFLLKVGIILVIAGGAFWYYLEEIRGRWLKEKKHSEQLGIAVGTVVLVAFLAGFVVIGTPQDARGYRFDAERVGDLQNLQSSIITYWQAKRTLPQSINDLKAQIDFVEPFDPETGLAYTYRTTGDLSFELCATFAEDAVTPVRAGATLPVKPGSIGNDNWTHTAGEQCFSRTIDPTLYPTPDQLNALPVPVR